MERLMTRQEVEDFVQLSSTTIYRLMHWWTSSRLRSKIGISAVRWRPEDIREWLDSRPTTKELNGPQQMKTRGYYRGLSDDVNLWFSVNV